MKKFVLILSALILALFVVGCGVDDPLNTNKESVVNEEATLPEVKIDDTKYDDSIEGIYQYLLDLELVSKSDATEMSAELIGATKGNKYSFKLNGKQVTVELYSYDVQNLDDVANDILNSVKNTGKFEILNLGEVEATISESGKYLMIYSDDSLKSSKPNSYNVENYNKVLEVFKNFKNK